MKCILKIFNFIIVLILLNISFIYAHPHLFIESNPSFVFKENKFYCVQMEWIWDELFSDAILMDCDKNKDLEFDQEELKLVYKDYFINIQDFDFFSILKINGEKNEYDVTGFTATIDQKNKKVSYYFNLIPPELPAKIEGIWLFHNDPTNYTSFGSAKNYPKVIGIEEINEKFKEEYEYYGLQFRLVLE
jgi:ABC-type uncharacterized transport system substrate-binding protein